MRRAPPSLSVPPNLLRHFAAVTVAITAGLAMFASGENKQVAQAAQPKPQAAAPEQHGGGGISALFGGAEAEALNGANKKPGAEHEIGGLKIGKNTRLANGTDWSDDTGPSEGGGSTQGGSDGGGGYYEAPQMPSPPHPYLPAAGQTGLGQPDQPGHSPQSGPGHRPGANGAKTAKAPAKPSAPTRVQIENMLAASRERASRSGNGSASSSEDE